MIKIASRYDSFDDIPWNREELISIMDKNFPNRPNDMIVIRIHLKNELKKLSDFININTKKSDFPHRNKT